MAPTRATATGGVRTSFPRHAASGARAAHEQRVVRGATPWEAEARARGRDSAGSRWRGRRLHRARWALVLTWPPIGPRPSSTRPSTGSSVVDSASHTARWRVRQMRDSTQTCRACDGRRRDAAPTRSRARRRQRRRRESSDAASRLRSLRRRVVEGARSKGSRVAATTGRAGVNVKGPGANESRRAPPSWSDRQTSVQPMLTVSKRHQLMVPKRVSISLGVGRCALCASEAREGDACAGEDAEAAGAVLVEQRPETHDERCEAEA